MYLFKLYLGGPIAGCSDAEASDWREAAKTRFHGVSFLDPMDRDYRGIEGDHTNEIVDLDKRDLERSTVALFYAPKPSVGTSMEILHCFNHGVPCVVVIHACDKISPWIRRHATKVVRTHEAAVIWIRATFADELLESSKAGL